MKRILAIILSLIMIVLCNDFNICADEKNTQIYDGRQEKEIYIVELSKPSLVEEYVDSRYSEKSDFDEYLETREAQYCKNTILKQQEQVINKINMLGEKQSIEILQQFSTIANAIVLKCTPSKMQELQSSIPIETCILSQEYDQIDPIFGENQGEDSKNSSTGTSLMNAMDLTYQGEGMVIAILDTGIDVNHEAFSHAPSQVRFKREDIQNILSTCQLKAEDSIGKELSVSDVYINDKIPYAFDYCDNDTNVAPTEEALSIGNAHGTHVAGIVGANSSIMSGLAKESQLVIMKIASDKGKIPDYVCLQALEDCITLGVDVINMSIGTACGFTNDLNDICLNAYERVLDTGISLVTAAGNYASSAVGNLYGSNLSLSSNPDTSTVSGPSTNMSAMSIASLENTIAYEPCMILNDGNKISFYDGSKKNEDSFLSLMKEKKMEYVYLGEGAEIRYSNKDVEGKIVVTIVGSITCEEKMNIAKEHGAIGLIVVSMNSGVFDLDIDEYSIPSVCITYQAGIAMVNQEILQLYLSKGDFVPQTTAGKISSNSSWGVTPDLRLKPDLTAVGGSVYSTLPFSKYGNMSGTSMAAPQISAVIALLKESLNQSIEFKNLSKREQVEYINNLMMSTATPVATSGLTVEGNTAEVYYSPRRQGAGLINVKAALQSDLVLYTKEHANRPVLNLGDDVLRTGVYQKEFYIKNNSNRSFMYSMNSILQTEDWSSDNTYIYISGSPTKLDGEVRFSIKGSSSSILEEKEGKQILTVAPYDVVEVQVKIILSDSDKNFIDTYFMNGEFIEGYVFLESQHLSGVSLSIPFEGFYGDFTSAPIFEASTYYDNPGEANYVYASNVSSYVKKSEYCRYLTQLRGYISEDSYRILGQNTYDNSNPYDKNKIAISPNGDGIFDKFYSVCSPLRNSKRIVYSIHDSKGEVLYTTEQTNIPKSICKIGSNQFSQYYGKVDWEGTDKDGSKLPNNMVVTFSIKSYLDFDEHPQNNLNDTITFPITIDTEVPCLKNNEIKEDCITLDVYDNQYVSYVVVYEYDNGKVGKKIEDYILNQPKKGATTTLSFTTSSNIGRKYFVKIGDYAGNINTYVLNGKTDNNLKEDTSNESNSNCSTSTKDVFYKMISSDIINYKNGVYVSFKEMEPAKKGYKIILDVSKYFKKDTKLYLYNYNKDKKILECIPSCNYKVSKEGKITIYKADMKDCILVPYIIQENKLSVYERISVPKKMTAKIGKKSKVKIQLPTCVEQVNSLRTYKMQKGFYGVAIQYKLQNNSIATVDKNGIIKAKKRGQTTLLVDMTFSNNVKKTYKVKLIVK